MIILQVYKKCNSSSNNLKNKKYIKNVSLNIQLQKIQIKKLILTFPNIYVALKFLVILIVNVRNEGSSALKSIELLENLDSPRKIDFWITAIE